MSNSNHFHDPAEWPRDQQGHSGKQGPSLEVIQDWLRARLAECLDLDPTSIDVSEPFTSYGLASIDAVGLSGDLEEWLGRTLSPTVAYDYPSIARLAQYLAGDAIQNIPFAAASSPDAQTAMEPVAIVGMACRFPARANTPEAFWHLLKSGKDAVTEIPVERWDPDAFYDPAPGAPGKMYTRYGCFLSEIDQFDAHFFGLSPREAQRMDPQQRLLVEVAWEALENAGLAVSELAGSQTGVFIGMMSNQEYAQLQSKQDDETYVDDPYYGIGSAASIAAGRLSYIGDFRGPTLTVDTACSSSLVATHLACQSLRNRECNLALVGGVNAILLPENMVNACKMSMLAPDGRCKTFDAAADGFVLGEGCGMVVLKRLADAIADQDTVLAIIRGSAVNQDGRSNGITAPSKLAQEAVIRKALLNAGVDALRLGYVEAHGSGTALGDPIEIEALSAALGEGRSQEQPLLVGSVKTNIGHLAGAAGIAGLIKAVLTLQHGEIPAHLHVTNLNPHVTWQEHPISIPMQTTPWHSPYQTRVAGISSFGWSGTNAHVILEESSIGEISEETRPWQLLLLSAKTGTALEQATDNLIAYAQNHPASSLVDIAYTLQYGRNRFEHRRTLLCRDREDAIATLTRRDPQRLSTSSEAADRRSVAFLFPGLGEQYIGMARELYQVEPAFRETVDYCCAFVKNQLRVDLDEALYQKQQGNGKLSYNGNGHTNGNGKHEGAGHSVLDLPALHGHGGRKGNGQNGHGVQTAFDRLKQTAMAQPIVFIIEYALAQVLLQWGLRPAAMLGYSLGEYVAACLAGVLSLEDALTLVTRRAQLIQEQPAGAMVAVMLSEAAIQPYLSEQVSLAAINSPQTCVLAGPSSEIERLEALWSEQDIASRRVETTHAFHSTMLDQARKKLTMLAQTLTLNPPAIAYLSNVTGTWITAEQATDPAYWARHMCQTVRFADGAERLLQDTEHVLLEVGLGQSLGSFVKQHPACTRERMQRVLSTLPSLHEKQSDYAFLLATLGKLWQIGVSIDWKGFSVHERRRRVALPTYPFERQSYWFEREKRDYAIPGSLTRQHDDGLERKSDVADWFYLPLWKQAVAQPTQPLVPDQKQCWMLFVDECGIGARLAEELVRYGQDVVTVTPGSFFTVHGEHAFSLRPDVRADYHVLLKYLREQERQPERVVHLWMVTPDDIAEEHVLQRGFYSLLALVQALSDLGPERCEISVISNDLHDVIGNERPCPEKAPIIGPCTVIPQEYPRITCRNIDIHLPDAQEQREGGRTRQLLETLLAQSGETMTALRGNWRWVQTFEPLRLQERAFQTACLRQDGVYLITGGLGGIGLTTAEYLARTVNAKLVLVGRSGLPPRAEWTRILEQQDTAPGVRRRIRKILDLEEQGAAVLVMQADVASEAQMQVVIQQAIAAFGALHGVFHAAGVPGMGLIQLKTPEQAAQVLLPKVQGTRVLGRVLHGLPLDFLVLFSSITSITGSPGQVDYCAANAFLDAYARRHRNEHGMTVAIDWSEWQWNVWEAGMDGYGDMGSFLKENRQRFGLTFEEGMEALKRALTGQKAQIIVSTQNFTNVVALSKSFTVAALLQEQRQEQQKKAVHLRPALQTSYVAPRNELERKIAALWGQLLGIEQVGINDNFFDLGGNSLLGVELINHTKKALNVEDLPAYVLYEAPSVSTMAHYLEQNQAEVPAGKTRERSEKRRESLKQRAPRKAR